MRYMFDQASQAFTATNPSSWNVGKVTDMYGMFRFTYEGSRNLSLSTWDVGEVTGYVAMFMDYAGTSTQTCSNGMFQRSEDAVHVHVRGSSTRTSADGRF